MSRSVALLVNPHAGGGRALRQLPSVLAELDRLGLRVVAHETSSLSHGCELAIAAADEGRLVVPFSGDGLIGAIAGALRDRPDAVMGLLPGGRGNDFARGCGIPDDPVAACRVLAEGREGAVDVGDVDGHTFVGIASVGFDSEANRIANEAPAWLGRMVYAYGALRALVSFKAKTFTVTIDGTRHELRAWTVAAANGKAYGGGMLLAPDARLDDGELDVVFAAPATRRRFVRCLPRVFKGTHVELPEITVLRGREVEIAADAPLTVYADGDPIAQLPTTVRAVPAALRMMLPA